MLGSARRPALGLTALLVLLASVAPLARSQTASQRAAADSVRTDSTSASGTFSNGSTADAADSLPVWPVPGPPPLPGSILPAKRIIAFYGNPLSQRMGILGQLPAPKMLAQLEREVSAWEAADSLTPVQPALHLIAMVAQADAGRDGFYRNKMRDTLVERVHGWAKLHNALLFLDLQVGLSTLAAEVPRFEGFLMQPDVHLGIDPEFAMPGKAKPGSRIGTLDADAINGVIDYLADLVTTHQLPPKVLVIHRFTQRMVTGYDRIKRDPRVQVVMHMDGFGPPSTKRVAYKAFVYREPVQFGGMKIFYKNDRRGRSRLMTPKELLQLMPVPLYIQYQ
jgi:hypothetical protein